MTLEQINSIIQTVSCIFLITVFVFFLRKKYPKQKVSKNITDFEFKIQPGAHRYSSQETAYLNTFKIRVIYVPLDEDESYKHKAKPVSIQLFGTTFGNKPEFTDDGNLEFKNEQGDKVKVIGLTRTMQSFYAITETEPFRLLFMRITAQTISQYENYIRIEQRTQWDSGKFNSVCPDDYNDPYQYQMLSVDVPINQTMDKKTGVFWDIDPLQIKPGIGIGLFINPEKPLFIKSDLPKVPVFKWLWLNLKKYTTRKKKAPVFKPLT